MNKNDQAIYFNGMEPSLQSSKLTRSGVVLFWVFVIYGVTMLNVFAEEVDVSSEIFSIESISSEILLQRDELVSVKMARQNLEYQIEQNDDVVRAIIAEIQQLNEALRRKDLELKAALDANEEYKKLRDNEQAITGHLIKLQQDLKQIESMNGDSADIPARHHSIQED